MPRKAELNVGTVARLLLCLSVMVSIVSTALAQEKPTTPAESMAKLIVVYRAPWDPAELDRYYAQVHIPIVKRMAWVRRLEVMRVTGAPGGGGDLFLIDELYFDNT